MYNTEVKSLTSQSARFIVFKILQHTSLYEMYLPAVSDGLIIFTTWKKKFGE